MEFISINQCVNIQRSDGRVHAAVVSKVSKSGKSLTVEWFERGETRGKDVELDWILALNPEILQKFQQKVCVSGPLNSARNEIQETKSPLPPRRAFVSGPVNSARNEIQETKSPLPRRAYLSSPVNSARNEIQETKSPLTRRASDRASLKPPSQKPDNLFLQKPTRTNEFLRSPTSKEVLRRMSSSTGSGLNSIPAGGGATRTSFVVKEVERIKAEREKRRQRQSEMKDEQVALKLQDPDNPHWEIAQMIREYQATLAFCPLTDGESIEDHQITVCLRKRPLWPKELNRKEIDVVSVPRKDTVIVHEPRTKVDLAKFLENHKFRFDYSFDENCDNALVYK